MVRGFVDSLCLGLHQSGLSVNFLEPQRTFWACKSACQLLGRDKEAHRQIGGPTSFSDPGQVCARLLGKRFSFKDLVREYEAPVRLGVEQDSVEHDRSYLPDVVPDPCSERSDPVGVYQSKHDVVDEVVVYKDGVQPRGELSRD